MRGEGTSTSDIDLVVMFEHLEVAWRESFIFDSWPVEAFVHDPHTLEYFFEEDKKSGVPSLPNMVFEGVVIPKETSLSKQLKAHAAEHLKQGPVKWDQDTIKHQRYMITDMKEDLVSPRNAFEARIIVASLHEALANFYLRANGEWSATRKHIPRRLHAIDATFAKRWNEVFDDAHNGNHLRLIKLVEEILQPFGGLVFDGYRRDSLKEWRLDPTKAK